MNESETENENESQSERESESESGDEKKDEDEEKGRGRGKSVRVCGTRRLVFSGSSTQIVASVDLLLALQRLRRLRQHLKHLRDHRGLEVQLRGVAAHRLHSLVQCIIVKVLVPQRVSLVPGVRDEVLGQVMLRGVDLGRAHQVHVPLVEVVQGLQARENNRNEHVEQESQIPGSCERFVCRRIQNSLHALVLRVCDSAYFNVCAIPRVLEVRRLALVSRWSSARPWTDGQHAQGPRRT